MFSPPFHQSYTEDFNPGTKIISTPGTYKLCSDITFGPNGPTQPNEIPSEIAFDPDLSNYAENEFGLGFFAALVIAADDVTLYLNGHTIEQSAGHALMQRFFAVIELANSPFIPGAGPAQFVSDGAYAAANNVNIFGPGVIGRSSHHGKIVSGVCHIHASLLSYHMQYAHYICSSLIIFRYTWQ